MPGPFDYENGISHLRHKLQSLLGVDLKTALASRFNLEPNQFRFVNDAAAFLLGEIAAGSAHGFARSIGITLGTGIGCAFATNERIAIPADQHSGDPGVPPGGEIWNLPYNGATVEDFVSTRFLRSRYLSLTGLEADVSAVAAIAHCQDNQPCNALEEVEAHQPQATSQATPKPHISHLKSGSEAREAFADFGLHLAQALNQYASAFNPNIIVLGGGIARAANLFLPATRSALAFPAQMAISTLMDEAPLAGAALHWFNSASLTV
jgi:glucokinase